jgi:hypothetical protein
VVARGELKAARETWRALPRTRRRALEVRGANPQSIEEALAIVTRGRYLRSWAGALEWVVGGAVGVAIATALQFGLAGELPWSPYQPLSFVVVFGFVGVLLRRWRGGQLIDRGQDALAEGGVPGDDAGPEDAGGEFRAPGPGG